MKIRGFLITIVLICAVVLSGVALSGNKNSQFIKTDSTENSLMTQNEAFNGQKSETFAPMNTILPFVYTDNMDSREMENNVGLTQTTVLPAISETVTFGRSLSSKKGESHTVTYLTSDEQIWQVDTVESGEDLMPPDAPPVLPGEVFTGWEIVTDDESKDLIVQEKTIPVAEMHNAIALGSGYCEQGKMLTLPLQLCGKVCLCGLDIRIDFEPKELQFKKFAYEDDGVICNYDNKKGEIKLNFLTPRNVLGDVNLCDLVFESIGGITESPLSITVKTIIAFDENDNLYEPKYRIVNGSIKIVK